MRASATPKPTRPPPTKAISDRITVQPAPCTRNCRWLMLNSLFMARASHWCAETAPAREHRLADGPERGAHRQRQQQVEHRHHDVGFERAIGVGLDTVGNR